ncbi:hypothetical protein CISIN_1g044998mg, partial [Citrus sinensis]
ENGFKIELKEYGPISKLSLLVTPTVYIYGQAANKFVYTCDDNALANQQPSLIRRIYGERSITGLGVDEHKRLRGALESFFKPEVLKQYVGKMDEDIRKHLNMHWHGKQKVAVMPLMKSLTFNIPSSLIFGIEQGATINAFIELFQDIMDGIVSIPINCPFTRFNRGLKIHQSSSVAFRGGPWICPGHEFTRIENLATIHHLVTPFSWKSFSSFQARTTNRN